VLERLLLRLQKELAGRIRQAKASTATNLVILRRNANIFCEHMVVASAIDPGNGRVGGADGHELFFFFALAAPEVNSALMFLRGAGSATDVGRRLQALGRVGLPSWGRAGVLVLLGDFRFLNWPGLGRAPPSAAMGRRGPPRMRAWLNAAAAQAQGSARPGTVG